MFVQTRACACVATCAHANVHVPARVRVLLHLPCCALHKAQCVLQAADAARTLQEVRSATQTALALVGELAEAQGTVAGLQGRLQRLQQKKEACVRLLAANQREAELLGATIYPYIQSNTYLLYLSYIYHIYMYSLYITLYIFSLI